MRRAPGLAALAVAGTVLRLVWLPVGRGNARFTNVDTTSYRTFAAALPGALGRPPSWALDASLQRSPGYPLLVWATGGARGSLVALLVVQCVLGGAVTVVLTHALARRWVGPRAALCAAGLVAVDPVSVAHALQVGTEVLFTVLLLATVLLAVRAREAAASGTAPWGPVLAAGATAGAAGLVRPQAIYLTAVLVVGVGVAVATARPGAGRVAGRRGLAAALVLALAAAAVGWPWLVRNRVVTDRWVVSTAIGQNLAEIGAASADAEDVGVAWWPEDDEAASARQDRARAAFERRYGRAVDLGDVVERDARWSAQGRRAIADHPRGFVVVTASSVGRTLAAPGDGLLLRVAGPGPPRGLAPLLRAVAVAVLLVEVGLGAVGVVALALRRRWGGLAVLGGTVGLYLLSSAGPQMYVRFRVPVVPLLAVLAAVGATEVVGRRRGTVSRPR